MGETSETGRPDPQRLRVVVFYADGQSSTTATGDDQVIVRTLVERGLDARTVDLADVRLDAEGALDVRDPVSGAWNPWDDPDCALMYHGAIAPADAMELLRAMQTRGTFVVNGPESWPVFADKLLFAQFMGARGVRVIPTHEVRSARALVDAVARLGGAAVVKQPVSTEGEGVFVVRHVAAIQQLAARIEELGGRLIVQPLIDSAVDRDTVELGVAAKLREHEFGRRHEFRIHTARMPDGTVSVDAAYMRIAASDEQVVNNVAQGARPIRVAFEDLHPRDRETVLLAARVTPAGGDFAGWDLIGQPGERMLIEANSGAGLPDGSEGIDPRDVTDSYATILRCRAEEARTARQRSRRSVAPRQSTPMLTST